MHLAREQQEGSEEEEKEDRAGEIGIVHYVLVDVPERIQHRQCLPKAVNKMFPSECRTEMNPVHQLQPHTFI